MLFKEDKIETGRFWDNLPISFYKDIINDIERKRKIRNYESLYENLKILSSQLYIVTLGFSKGVTIYRMRQNLQEGQLMEQGINFPYDPKYASEGRFNYKEQIMAYYADSIETCNAETSNNKEWNSQHLLKCIIEDGNPQLGFSAPFEPIEKLKKNSAYLIYQEMISEYKSKIKNNEIFEKKRLVTNYLGNEICNSRSDYFITQVLSHIIFSDLGFDGLIYPSTKMRLKRNNIVFPPDNALKFVKPYMAVGRSHEAIYDIVLYDRNKK